MFTLKIWLCTTKDRREKMSQPHNKQHVTIDAIYEEIWRPLRVPAYKYENWVPMRDNEIKAGCT